MLKWVITHLLLQFCPNSFSLTSKSPPYICKRYQVAVNTWSSLRLEDPDLKSSAKQSCNQLHDIFSREESTSDFCWKSEFSQSWGIPIILLWISLSSCNAERMVCLSTWIRQQLKGLIISEKNDCEGILGLRVKNGTKQTMSPTSRNSEISGGIRTRISSCHCCKTSFQFSSYYAEKKRALIPNLLCLFQAE